MADRYFVEEPIAADRVTLTDAEAHHLIHVMRASPGDRVALFDGGGDEFQAVVEKIGRSDVKLSILSRDCVDRELPFSLTLAVALPKGDRQRWLVEKATELGVTRIVPLHTRRGVAQPTDSALERLRRAVVEASKQCGRNRLMQVDAPQSWAELLAATKDEPCRWVAHPADKPAECSAASASQEDAMDFRRTAASSISQGGKIFAAIGPEGGFEDEEIAAAVAAGWRTVDLGPRILRVETAAIFLASRIIAE